MNFVLYLYLFRILRYLATKFEDVGRRKSLLKCIQILAHPNVFLNVLFCLTVPLVLIKFKGKETQEAFCEL